MSEMKNCVGMPGPGGSIGQCAICGKPFLAEILLWKTVKSFSVNGCDQTLFGHDKCLNDLKKVKVWKELPEGPLRKAYENREEKP